MLAQIGARFAAVGSAARDVCRKRLNIAVPLVVLTAGGLASGCTAPLAGQAHDPADPAAKVAGVGYRSTVAPYSSLRPAVPTSWREQNQRVAPSPPSDR
jgi:hypothetical protein